MIFIPGWLISIFTFPGVIIHEWSHKKFCDWTGVKVNKVVYFRFGNPAGYVLHDKPTTYKQTFYISAGPLFLNSVLTLIFGYLASQTYIDSGLYFIFLWIAISAGMHAFPSDHDGKNIVTESKNSLKEGGTFIHYLAYPFYWILWIANKLRFFWFDLVYAIMLVYAVGGLQ
ncbi:hypothetical protein C0583_00235 [Candidatus Parcubacteria bacterium]|nr:MAG: hypothetical protein C0583_00235 [Candidatus Parcubacteria bacterium]